MHKHAHLSDASLHAPPPHPHPVPLLRPHRIEHDLVGQRDPLPLVCMYVRETKVGWGKEIGKQRGGFKL